ncbi:hybrid sensor histidine kinase/response regulator [Paraburkholderia hospita]|uniref:hybrid sensor histidine kinase/response regulator n=1 Tax=Paraburkholderia hospita TaxID=169430 RepID=UPI0009A57704|nr:ATP-binding protein [Paraburkholderia hospita]SKC77241.1 Signal transduction histidine kinase [Paraburkholderia hospita]
MAGPSASRAVERALRAGALITAVLEDRPHRAPDFAAESRSMHQLAQALTAPDSAVLQTLADIAPNLCDAGSAGISLFEQGEDRKPVLRWVALSGAGAAFANTEVPSEDSPSGATLELGTAQLFSFPQRHFACLQHVRPGIIEELVVPIPGQPEPWGALWVMSHDEERLFDGEDRRILTSLANFTCAALTMSRAKADAEARAAEAEATRNALALAEARKDDFIATLSHELRNPIAPIDSALMAARKLATDNPAVLSALSIADRQLRLLKRLVSDLLDASRIRHGKPAVRPSYALLQDIVADAVTAMKADDNNGRHQLHITVPPYPVTVHADPARLTQVVSNLLSNAVKYTPPGGDITLSVEAPDLSVEPTDSSSPSDVVITVKDNGTGISASLQPHVFDMFAQSASARKRAEGGLGIGLAVVKHLVAAHNGTVTIASAGEGQGTEVTIRLPIVCKSMGDSTATASRTIVSRRILLVDDCADATEALGTLLELEGHEVRRATNGPDALFIVESFTPDVALIDITMPGMDGLELAQLLRLRAQCSLTRLVALTGYIDSAGRLQTDERVFDAHFTKPLSLDDLEDVLRPS